MVIHVGGKKILFTSFKVKKFKQDETLRSDKVWDRKKIEYEFEVNINTYE